MINIWQVYHIIWHRYSILCCFHLFPQQRCALGSPCGVAWARGFGQTPSPKPPKTWFLTPKSWSKGSQTWFPKLGSQDRKLPKPGSQIRNLRGAWLKHVETGFLKTRCSGNLHQPRPETSNTFVHVRNRRREVLLEPPRGSHRRLQREPASEILWKATVLDGGGKMWSRHLRWHNIHEHVRWTNCQTWHTIPAKRNIIHSRSPFSPTRNITTFPEIFRHLQVICILTSRAPVARLAARQCEILALQQLEELRCRAARGPSSPGMHPQMLMDSGMPQLQDGSGGIPQLQDGALSWYHMLGILQGI